MSSPTDDSRKTKAIRSCVERLRSRLKDRFILIGGASMLLLGSQRATNDVDILVPSDEDVPALVSFLAADKSFSNEGGHLQFQHPDFSPSLDILTIAVERMTFEQAHPHCLTIKEVKVPRPDYSLAMKVQCFYLRQDDENGEKKRASDLRDIEFLLSEMVKRSEFFGHYHLLELRQELGAEHFIRVGGRKFMLPWDQNSEAQKESGADPFTVELEEE
ncbi:hypothetical protein PCH_Pc13g10730 [Penicillium rubens Wisconsin 54-1255]|uniref:Uncharacterized protein n=1 Tax=Penicillium rubens (strain ATCC 28089 / DSM 1075 / NRRL 1951 / Wisconsin 54-1255) TaxID=500485 RepID=B6H409_PENRW|nr:hypothetical protein PCH_Pc13g10730 [Penicillium rubens Wisconsin 54-1255]